MPGRCRAGLMQDTATPGQPRASGALKGNGWGGAPKAGIQSFIHLPDICRLHEGVEGRGMQDLTNPASLFA